MILNNTTSPNTNQLKNVLNIEIVELQYPSALLARLGSICFGRLQDDLRPAETT